MLHNHVLKTPLNYAALLGTKSQITKPAQNAQLRVKLGGKRYALLTQNKH